MAARLLVGDLSGRIYAWNTRTGEQMAGFIGHTGPIWDIAFSPDGQRMVSTAGDGSLRLWDGNTGRELLVLEDNRAGDGVAFSPDGCVSPSLAVIPCKCGTPR